HGEKCERGSFDEDHEQVAPPDRSVVTERVVGQSCYIDDRTALHAIRSRRRRRGVSWSGEIVGQNQQVRTISDAIAPTVTPHGVKIATMMQPPPKIASSNGNIVGPLNSYRCSGSASMMLVSNPS